MGVHYEKPFEDFIADHLVSHGWMAGDPTLWNRPLALDTANLFAFIRASQPKKWERLIAVHGDNVMNMWAKASATTYDR